MIYTWFKEKKVDVAFLQEMQTIEKNIYSDGTSVHAFTNYQSSREVTILFLKELTLVIHNIHRLENGRMLLVNAK